MKPADALADLLVRVAAADGAAAMFSERELGEWPATAVGLLKAEKLLVKGSPADVVTCPGCEEDCTMPVETAITRGGQLRAFVVCDKRDDVGRVPVAPDLIEQWRCSPERLADVLARLLGIRRSEGDTVSATWNVGVLKGAKHSAHVVLGIGRGMELSIAGHTLALADVLELGDKGLVLDRRALVRCVDSPVGAAGDSVSRESRVERLRKRRNELKTAGVRNFNQVLANEEGVSVSAIKQLLAEKKASPSLLDRYTIPGSPVSKKPKTRY
jgi:hypothetical protein